MKFLALSFFLLSCFSFSLQANQSFGKKIDVAKVKLTPISELIAAANEYKNKEVTIKGMVTNVCSMRGCWMEFASDKKYQTLRLKVRDGDMVFPLSAKGKLAYARGTINSKTYTKEELQKFARQRAEKSGKTEDLAKTLAKITGPKTYLNFIPVGVTIE